MDKISQYSNEDAWEIHLKAQHMVNVNKASSVAIGILIHHISSRSLYKEIGFDTLDEYMSAPQESAGLDIAPRTGYRYESIARKFVFELGIDETVVAALSPTKLDVLAPHATPDNIQQVLTDAEILSTSSIRKNLNDGAYGNAPTDSRPMVLSIRKELLDAYVELYNNAKELLWPSDPSTELAEANLESSVRKVHELKD